MKHTSRRTEVDEGGLLEAEGGCDVEKVETEDVEDVSQVASGAVGPHVGLVRLSRQVLEAVTALHHRLQLVADC